MSYPVTAAETTVPAAGPADGREAARWAALSGPAFVVFFLAGVVASSPPGDNASVASWVANYTGGGNNLSHEASGVFLVLAALSLMSFLAVLWSRIGRARPGADRGMLPLLAAGVSAACIAVGGALMGSGSTVTGNFAGAAAPGAATLARFCNDAGFVMVTLPGMLAAALAVAGLSLQAYRAKLFGRRMAAFGLVVAVILIPSLAFFPIIALLVWLVVTAVVLLRRDPVRQPAGR
jgi:hypothetical protein